MAKIVWFKVSILISTFFLSDLLKCANFERVGRPRHILGPRLQFITRLTVGRVKP